MKKRYFKIIAAIALVAIMALSLFSCGQSAPASVTGQRYDGKSGENSVSVGWDYDSSTYTLTITGSGDMPNATSANGVAWSSIKGYVKTIKFVNQNNVPITSIGDYAFYGMSSLTSVELPDGITKIGKLAFGYCFSLKNITTNKNLTSIGESAFEGCLSLKEISLPTNVTRLEERAFAFCKNLEKIIIAGKLVPVTYSDNSQYIIGKWTFKDCQKLASVKMPNIETKDKIADNAFEGCKIAKDKIEFVTLGEDGKVAITVTYTDEKGGEVFPTEVKYYDFGEAYTLQANEADGYSRNITTIVGVADSNKTEKFTYTSNTPIETTPSETTPTDQAKPADEGITTGTIIGISIFAVVIIALGVVIFIFMRPSKDNKNGKNNQKKR